MRPTPAVPESGGLDRDTIAAIATAPGVGGIGIVRVSGPDARAIGEALTAKTLAPRRATYSSFANRAGDHLDAGIVLLFPGPASFTGEDVVEFQGHGGPVVLRLVLEAVIELGARLARPGEFTERAFLNGKLDLAQAEAVADLISSASAAAARAAMRSLEGEFSRLIEAIDQAVLALRIYVEAAMDFPDEAIEFLAEGQVDQGLEDLERQLKSLLLDTRQGVLLRDGIVIALIGPPNVGKSSLLNRLAGQERAIVSDIPGTTRDLVRADLAVDGLPLQIVDTAGLRESVDPVEQEGVRRAREQAARADLILLLEEDAVAREWDSSPLKGSLAEILPQAESRSILRVLNKVDASGRLPGMVSTHRSGNSLLPDPASVRISALTGSGMEDLIRLIKERVGYDSAETTFIARQRHVDALHAAARAVAEARRLLASSAPAELVAEELRGTHLALGSIVGTVSADELLGEIFSRFCIGK